LWNLIIIIFTTR